MTALDNQIGGNHYKDFAIQPVEFIHKNGIDFLSGNVIKYVCRYSKKGGLKDLEKANHYIEILMQFYNDKMVDEGRCEEEGCVICEEHKKERIEVEEEYIKNRNFSGMFGFKLTECKD